ncbi:MAG: NfeD family protein [Bacteroidaceae bacterium]|nr:NfeD family protein [Bacteroidaceae bacterium]
MELLIIILLLLLGIVLLSIEIALIPGIGVTGIFGVISLIASICYAFVTLGNVAGWTTALIAVAAGVLMFMWAVYGKSIDKVALNKKIDSKVENPELDVLKVGDTGVAITRLALIGEAEFNGALTEVKSSGGFIDEGAQIVVERITDKIIYVKKANN